MASASKDLPSKVAADADRSGRLVFLGHVDAGRLNEVVELWHYDSMAASLRAREASRAAKEWRAAVAGAADIAVTFRTQMMRPVALGGPWS